MCFSIEIFVIVTVLAFICGAIIGATLMCLSMSLKDYNQKYPRKNRKD